MCRFFAQFIRTEPGKIRPPSCGRRVQQGETLERFRTLRLCGDTTPRLGVRLLEAMKLPSRISFLFFIGVFAVGSTALGYYYYYVYEPPLKAAAQFMNDMQKRDAAALKSDVVVSSEVLDEEAKLREPTDREIQNLLDDDFQRG